MHLLALAAIAFVANPLARVVTSPSTDIPCSELIMPPENVPDRYYRAFYYDNVSVPIVLNTPIDPIVSVKIALPINEFETPCGDAYEADLTGNTVTLQFHHGGAYFVVLSHQSGARSAGVFMVKSFMGTTVGDGKPPKVKGKQRRIEIDSSAFWVYDPEFGGVLSDEVNSVPNRASADDGGTKEDLAEIVCDEYEENGQQPFKLVLAAHGAVTADGEPVGGHLYLDPTNPNHIDKDTAGDYGALLKGKVTCIDVLSCYAALGPCGEAMLQNLADAACVPTRGYTGCVTYTEGDVWQWFPPGYVRKFKMYASGDLVQKDPTPQQFAGSSAPSIAPVAAVQGLALWPTDVFLPLGYGQQGSCAYTELFKVLGTVDTDWDLDGDGVVSWLDLDVLLVCTGVSPY